jgi:hypothetical protein
MSDFERLQTGPAELAEVNDTLAAWRDNDNQQAHIVQFYEDDAFLIQK